MAVLKSQASEIRIGDGASPIAYTAISQTVSITGPDGSASSVDTTALDSIAKEYFMGLPDEGSVQFECIHDPSDTQHELLRANRAAQTETGFQIALTDSPETTYQFFGYVTGFSLSLGVDDATKASYTVLINGAVTKS
jgi:hypothetical protein